MNITRCKAFVSAMCSHVKLRIDDDGKFTKPEVIYMSWALIIKVKVQGSSTIYKRYILQTSNLPKSTPQEILVKHPMTNYTGLNCCLHSRSIRLSNDQVCVCIYLHGIWEKISFDLV